MTSPSANTRSLTGQNLSHVIDELLPTEKIVITKNADGSTRIVIENVQKKLHYPVYLQNKLVAHLSYQPVRPGWMAYSEEGTPETKALRKEHRKTIIKKARENKSTKDLFKDQITFVLEFMNISQATRIKSDLTEYYVFTLGDKKVYTRENKIPVMYFIGESKQPIYL